MLKQRLSPRALIALLTTTICLAVAALVVPATSSADDADTGAPRVDCSWVHDPDLSLADAYRRAATEAGVPVRLLLAVSYLESRWEDHRGLPSNDGGFGPMHLTDLPAARKRPQARSIVGFGTAAGREGTTHALPARWLAHQTPPRCPDHPAADKRPDA